MYVVGSVLLSRLEGPWSLLRKQQDLKIRALRYDESENTLKGEMMSVTQLSKALCGHGACDDVDFQIKIGKFWIQIHDEWVALSVS